MNTYKTTMITVVVMMSFILHHNYVFSQENTIPVKNRSIKMLNKSLIFDLFLNYELSEQNGRIKYISEYLPNIDGDDVEKIILSTNHNNSKEKIEFEYDDGLLNSLLYEINSKDDRTRKFTYTFFYDNDRVTHIKIGKKTKFLFEYDSNGKISIVRRQVNRLWHKYHLTYSSEESKVFLKLTIQKGVKKRVSKKKYFVAYNEEYFLSEFYIDNYLGNSIVYDENNNIKNLSISIPKKEDIQINCRRYTNKL